MIKVSACKYCGSKNPIVIDKSFIDLVTGGIKHRVKIICDKCPQEFETETNDIDIAICAWNKVNDQRG